MITKLYYVDPDNQELTIVSQQEGYEDEVTTLPVSATLEFEEEEDEEPEPEVKKKKNAAGGGVEAKGGSNKWITEEDKVNIVRMAKDGKSVKEIVVELGLKYPAVFRIVKMSGVLTLQPPAGQKAKAFDPDEEVGVSL